jgi:hypothetical protein
MLTSSYCPARQITPLRRPLELTSYGAYTGIARRTVTRARWKRDVARDGAEAQNWRFADDQGRHWRCVVSVAGAEHQDSWMITAELQRRDRAAG